MRMSEKGLEFTVRHEGFVSRAYRDPTGTWTIGTGFTNASAVARRMIGTIAAGKTISREYNQEVLRAAFDEEYGPPVARRFPAAQQHEFDGAGSFTFNVGPGGLKWTWADSLAAGRVAEAAARLKTTATTSKGKKLPGLVTRRAEEAALIQHANYGTASIPTFEPTKPTSHPELLRRYQGYLAELGLYSGRVDGLYGSSTAAAVRAFQQQHPQLVVDGVLGRATMAQIDRVMDLRRQAGAGAAAGGAAGGAAGAGGGAVLAEPATDVATSAATWGIAAAVLVVVVVLAFLAWRYRDELRLASGRRRG